VTIHRTHGARAGPTEYAPGHIVVVVREGSGWVLLQEGTQENLSALFSSPLPAVGEVVSWLRQAAASMTVTRRNVGG